MMRRNLPFVRGVVGRGDAAVLAALVFLAGFLFLPPLFLGRAFFWGDLTYIHYPWRSLEAEIVQGGALPLWDPYAYLGMPLAAQMQGAAWYPGTLFFYLLPFSAALALYHWAHFGFAGLFMYLWLRRLGLPRPACAGGAAAYMLGGSLISRIPFLNHLSTLAYFPAFLLFIDHPVLLALAAASAFLSGYAPMLAGEFAACAVFSAVLSAMNRRSAGGRIFESLRSWIAAGALCAVLCACLLLPAIQLAMDSRRASGVQAQESLTWSYEPADLVQFTAPPLIGKDYSPTLSWWKTSYVGLGVGAAAVWGLASLPAGASVALSAYLAAVVLLILGASNPVSRWLWLHAAPLRYIRYPGNTAYLASPAIAYLAAVGIGAWAESSRRAWGERGRKIFPWLIVAGIAGELLFYAAGSQPVVARGYFTDAGPLVRALRAELGTHRYLSSPLALQWHRGSGSDPESAAEDLKHRLYGLTNLPYHLPAVANFGEPLVPNRCYEFMDFLYQRPSLDALTPWLGWADVGVLLTRDKRDPGPFTYLGLSLWHMYRAPGPVARVFWFDEERGARLPRDIPQSAPKLNGATALDVERPREDGFAISGSARRPGWLFVSEPYFSGWRAAASFGAIAIEPALGAFQKLRVPAGAWRVFFRYDPSPWRAGRAITVLAVCVLAAYWYNLLRRSFFP